MKNKSLIFILALALAISMFSSCSKDSRYAGSSSGPGPSSGGSSGSVSVGSSAVNASSVTSSGASSIASAVSRAVSSGLSGGSSSTGSSWGGSSAANGSSGGQNQAQSTTSSNASASVPASQTPTGSTWPASGSVPSALSVPNLDGSNVYKSNTASIDLSYISYGFVKIRLLSKSSGAFKVWISKGSDYYYDLKNTGGTEIYPLQLGSGSYDISVLQRSSNGGYYYVASTTVNVSLLRSDAPYLVPSQIVNYTGGSTAVAIAKSLVRGQTNNYQRISTVLSYVANHISYDYNLAKTVKTGYIPNIDADLARGKGICYDYAAISAAMLRSLGYPTRLVMCYVEDGSVYHAWNEVYLSGKGWIKVLSVKLNTNGWSRVDVTFISGTTSSAAIAKYIGDSSNYQKVYVY
ncbi:MAG: transglutaminase-like domain-containing protein [Clostridia bacterium]|nr:transglutaminase-like domain-containing protein [Clostridia bacterium]